MINALRLDGTKYNPEYTVQELPGKTVVTISADTNGSNIKSIDFDYFGTVAHEGDEGYMLAPNYGTLCYFKNHTDSESLVDTYAMPVFGVKTEKRCFVAIVTGMAYNYTLVFGVKDGAYYIYPRFHIDGDRLYEDISISYCYLTGDDADYSGMARAYRAYQLERGECIPLRQRAEKNPVLAYARDSVMIRVRLGWKPVPTPVMHQTSENEPEMITACTFEKVGEIIDELKRQGVEKAEICLVGWNTKGHDGRWPQCFPVEEELGGEEGLRRLIIKAKKMGYQIVCHSNNTDTYEISELWNEDDLIIKKDGTIPKAAPWSAGQMYQICPKVAYEQAKKSFAKIAALGFHGVHYIDVLNTVMPRRCYNPKHTANIRESIEVSRKMMSLARDTFGGYSSEGGFDFGAKYLDYALTSNFDTVAQDPICDEIVPFWQLVYHGIILSNPNMNCTLNYSLKDDPDAKLKLIEYGGRPTYYYYSRFRGDWISQAGEDLVCDNEEQLHHGVACILKGYNLYREMCSLQNEFMEKHEQVSPGVYRIDYSDGTEITVDYNNHTFLFYVSDEQKGQKAV